MKKHAHNAIGFVVMTQAETAKNPDEQSRTSTLNTVESKKRVI